MIPISDQSIYSKISCLQAPYVHDAETETKRKVLTLSFLLLLLDSDFLSKFMHNCSQPHYEVDFFLLLLLLFLTSLYI